MYKKPSPEFVKAAIDTTKESKTGYPIKVRLRIVPAIKKLPKDIME